MFLMVGATYLFYNVLPETCNTCRDWAESLIKWWFNLSQRTEDTSRGTYIPLKADLQINFELSEHACSLSARPCFTFTLLRHREAIVRASRQRNSFSGDRSWLRGRRGMFLWLIQPSGGPTAMWAQSGPTAASERFCDERPAPTSSAVEILMCTQESRPPRTAFLRAALSNI